MENAKNTKAFLVTARKWRPQRFDALVGQEALALALRHALQTGKTAHAYLFSGIRGVGKTSTARLLAKALNCIELKDGEPCGHCAGCVSINDGSAMDVMEIDGASNRGIEAIRELRDTVAYMPVKLRRKVYIIDEVHMLTTEASNALLKTLEEPPPHVVFILATTEGHKLLPTIRSRCQHYIFKKIPVAKMAHQLAQICDAEGYVYEKEALYEVAEAGDGSLRDAESIFDQVVIYTEGKLTLTAVREVLGISPESSYEQVWLGIAAQDVIHVLRAIDEYMQNFGDVRGLVWGMVDFLRQGLLVKRLPFGDEMVDMSEEKYKRYGQMFATLEASQIVRMMQIMAEFLRALRSDKYDRLAAEMVLVQLTDHRNLIPLAEIRDELIKHVASGAPLPKREESSSSAPRLTPTPQVAKPLSSTTYSSPSKREDVGTSAVASPPLAKPVISEQATAKGHAPIQSPPNRGDDAHEMPAGGANVAAREEIERAFFALLGKSPLSRPMPKDIERVQWDGHQLIVYAKAKYVLDFLKNAKQKLAEAMMQTMGCQVELVPLMVGEKPSVSQPPTEPEPRPLPQPKAEPGPAPEKPVSDASASVSSTSGEKTQGAKDAVRQAEDLFQAKRL